MRTLLLELTNNTEIHVDRDTQYVLDLSGTQPGEKYTLDLIFDREGVTGEILGIYESRKGNDLDLTTVAHHKVPNTSCMTNIRGVLYEGAVSNYVGKILIDKNAQQTSSFLQDNVLVLGDNVVNNSQPLLQIDANDVKASHGATTGRISEEQIYYLTSRGLSREQAEKVIVTGFFSSLISRIHDDNIKKKVFRQVTGETLAGEPSMGLGETSL